MAGPALRMMQMAVGPQIEVSGSAPKELPAGSMLWQVLGGDIEIFMTTPDFRRLIAVIPSGGCVVAMPECDGAVLSVTGSPGATLNLVAEPGAQDPTLAPPPTQTLADWSDAVEKATGYRIALADGLLEHIFAEAQAGLLDITAALRGQVSETDQRTLTRLAQRKETGRDDDRASGVIIDLIEALGLPKLEILPTGPGGYLEMPGLLRQAGAKARAVTLPIGWSRADAGPLVVFTARSGTPIALLWSKGGYRDRDGKKLSARDEERFDAAAYCVHAPLPESVRGLGSLAVYLLPLVLKDGVWAARAGACISLIGAITPLAASWLLSDIVPSNQVGLLIAVGVALFAAALMNLVFSAARSLALARLGGRTSVAVAAAVSDKVLRLPTRFFQDYAAGDLTQRIGAIEYLRALITDVMMSSVLTLVFSLFYLAVLLSFDAALAGAALLLVLIYILATAIARWAQMAPMRQAAELDGRLAGASYETLSGIAKLRVAAAEERAFRRWFKLYREEQAAKVRAGRVGAHFAAFSDAYQIITLLCLFGLAAYLMDRDLPAGQFIAFLVAFGAFQGAFSGFCGSLMAIFTAAPMAERARPLLEAAAETEGGRADPGPLQGAIELAGVTFAYPGGRTVLDGLDLSVAPGEHVAIVGASGSGKSTILRLLLGFETPQAGTITFDGQDLSRLQLGRVRSQIGVVMQSSRLFAGSILDNIRGATDAGLGACTEAAYVAGLERDLELFPMGLHTPVTEGAATLSGGQKQRILIARAIVGAPPIQFFDEATSALDNLTQRIVMETLDASHATRITIAHRLSTVRNADRICVLEGGRIVESGPFDTLIAGNGKFAELAQRQLIGKG
ncbi:MAG: ATP-binding cassette domain-containing protein [Pseudomonadota bacterium]